SDGLLPGYVFATHRMTNGIVWVATSLGVSRFDGTNFVNFTIQDSPALKQVITIASTPDGAVWFGSMDGGLARYESGRFTHFNETDGLLAPNTRKAVAAPDGALWFRSGLFFDARNGLVRFDGRSFESFAAGTAFSSNVVADISLARDGTMWMIQEGGEIVH